MIKNYTCPNCGAPLQYKETDSIVHCEYCSSTIDLAVTDEERQIRLGKANAEKIKEYKKHFLTVQALKIKINDQSAKYNKLLNQIKSLKVTTVIAFCVLGLIAICLAIPCVSSIFSFSDILSFILEIASVGGIAYALVYFGKIKYSKDYQKISSSAEKEKSILTELQKEYDHECLQFDIEYIDERYRNIQALDFIISALETERAFTLNQAQNLWNDKKERDLLMQKIEEVSQIAKDNSDETKSISTQATVAGAAAVVGAAVARGIVKEISKHL